MKSTAVSRRQFLQMMSVITGSVALSPLLQSCGGSKATMADWTKPADVAKAKEQAKDYITYGMPDDWANYGEVLQLFMKKYGFELKHTDTDMSSLEEITKFDAEKNNPAAISADIGIMYGPVAEQKGVLPNFIPPNAAKLPAGLKAKNGGWVPTFVGVPAMVINTDVIKNVPKTWKDLLEPEFKGKVGTINAAGGGATDMNVFFAWVYDNGGDQYNLDAGVEFAKKMAQQYASASPTVPALEKGEVPIWLRYDFNCIAAANAVKKNGVGVTVVLPPISIYGPSALMINKYNTAKMDVAKLFLDFVLTDEAQVAFARFGARPIRYTLGDLTVPDDIKANWLPDEAYAQVAQIKDWNTINAEEISKFFREKVLGG
jgi:putative spermidine/putrescine transport system substrate-binding protein